MLTLCVGQPKALHASPPVPSSTSLDSIDRVIFSRLRAKAIEKQDPIHERDYSKKKNQHFYMEFQRIYTLT